MSDVQFSSQLAHLAECHELETGPRSLADRLRFWCRAAVEWTRSDVIFLERDLSPLLGWCVIAALLRWRWRCMLACVDLLLPRPVTRRDKVLAAIKSLLLRNVDLIILFQKDFAAYERYYHLRPSQLKYVPFKTNFLDIVQTAVVADDGYCWSGGTTYRDWTTLAKAVEGLDIRIVITIPDDDELKRRGEADDKARLRRGVPGIVPDKRMFGPNVTILRHGPDPRSWIGWAARARCAIIPIHPRTISSSGVSTYLTVLALRKPLIISSVASTIGILDEKTAMLVPAGDPLALRAAILRLDADPELRASLADAGSRYAAQTGDTSRLHSDYLRHLLNLAGASMGEPAGGDLPQSPMPASEPPR